MPSLHLALIDDNQDDRALILRVLRRDFPEMAVTAISDAEGLDRLLASPAPDLVITDYMLGWDDGITILKRIKARLPHCPVIMFTGTGDEEIAVEAMKAGLDDYVLKAARHFTRLSSAVRIALERMQERRAAQQAESRYQALFTNLPMALYRTSLDGRMLDGNLALVQVFDFPSLETLREGGILARYACPADRKALLTQLESRGLVQNFSAEMLRHDGTRFWAEITAHLVAGENGVPYLEGSIEDVTARRQAEQALAESYERLREVLDGTVQSLASVSEWRDPYTAGHQRQVAQLACAIAERLGLDAETCTGIRVAALLHDIGKLAVPQEILVKPGRLNAYEFKLIEQHPRVGYEILQEINFPWPVSEIVLGHHQRQDGTGYPDSAAPAPLRLETQIVIVADVVEAMSSHRPYRPALGLDAALTEIRQHAGAKYDLDVVQACLELAEGDALTFLSA